MRVSLLVTMTAALVAVIGLPEIGKAGPAALSVGSTTFQNNASVPDRIAYNATSCRGKNVSPELHWGAAPTGTRSYALTTWDPDAPAAGGWWHWVLYDIPARVHRIAEGHSAGLSGTTSFRATGYSGPCPPPGAVHHYRFTVYALNSAHIGAAAQTTGPELLEKMRGHILGQGVIVGLYKR